MTPETLRKENCCFRDTAGVSQNNRTEGFCAAFQDRATGLVYLSCFANGSPAPVHLLEGLPDELVLERNTEGQVITAKPTVVAGFLRGECFYTREETARLLAAVP